MTNVAYAAHAASPSATPDTSKVVTFAGAAFLLGIFTKTVGFDLPETALATQLDAAPSSSMLPVVVFMGATAALLVARLLTVGPRMPTIVPLAFLALLAWCAASLSWSAVPSTAGFRLAQTVAIPVFVLLAVETLGVRLVLKATGAVLALALVMDYAYVALLPGAKHLSNEIDSALVGNWRGVHAHKNVAGGVLAVSVLFFVRAFAQTRRKVYVLAILASLVFIWMTRSKTSLALLLLVVSVFSVLPYAIRNGTSSGLTLIGTLVAGGVASIFLVGYHDTVWGFVTDRGAFTGRGALWEIMSTYAQGHPWFGSGFGSFWRIGPSGPSFALATGWNAMAFNGHNGYMDALVTTGAPGLALLVVALVLVPVGRALRAVSQGLPDATFLASILTFVALHNFFETTFLNGSSQLWMLFCVALFCLGQVREDAASSTRRSSVR